MRRILLSLLLLLLAFPALGQAINPPPSLINFQGRLAKPDGTPVADGANYSVTLSLWDTPTVGTGTMRWQQVFSNVTVRNGVFAVLLNLTAGFTSGNTLDSTLNNSTYLQIQIGSNAALTPRQQMVSVPFALKAATVPDGSITAAKLAANARSLTGPAGGDLIGTYPTPQIKTDPKLLNQVSGTLLQVPVSQSTTAVDQAQSTPPTSTVTSSAWQSFTVGTTGTLVEIDVYTGTQGGPVTATLSLYAGQGNSGSPLVTVPITVNPTLGLQSFPITYNATAGQVYTWSIGSDNNLLFGYVGGNPYANGQADLGSNFDYTFQTLRKVNSGPPQQINASGNFYMVGTNSILGDPTAAPMITRQYDPFTSGAYNGIGRFGLFQEPNTLFLGIPASDAGARSLVLGGWGPNKTRTDFVTLLNSGNMGIGTSTPAQKLSVAGTIESTSGGFKFPDGTIQTKAALGGNIWGTNNGTDIFNTNTGSVGIGTNTPQAKLDVNGGIRISSQNVLEFGAGVAGKQTDAGKIGYGTFDVGVLDIVGAGTTGTNRQVKIYSEGGLTVTGSASVSGNLTAGGILNAASITTSGSINAASITTSGSINAASIIASGTFNAASINVNGGITAGGSVTFGNVVSLGNFGSDGAIGSAGATVDATSTILINQSTAFRSLTIPNPGNTTAGRMVRIVNTGSAKFQVQGTALIAPSRAISFLWTGSTWLPDTNSKKVLTGTVNFGDIGGGTSPRGAAVTGDFSGASLTNLSGSAAQTTVNLGWSMSNYIVMIAIGTTDWSSDGYESTNDLHPPVTGNLTATSFQIRWEETSNTTQTVYAQIMVIEQ